MEPAKKVEDHSAVETIIRGSMATALVRECCSWKDMDIAQVEEDALFTSWDLLEDYAQYVTITSSPDNMAAYSTSALGVIPDGPQRYPGLSLTITWPSVGSRVCVACYQPAISRTSPSAVPKLPVSGDLYTILPESPIPWERWPDGGGLQVIHHQNCWEFPHNATQSWGSVLQT